MPLPTDPSSKYCLYMENNTFPCKPENVDTTNDINCQHAAILFGKPRDYNKCSAPWGDESGNTQKYTNSLGQTVGTINSAKANGGYTCVGAR